MISNKTKYGLQAVIYLAKNHSRGPILIAELSKQEKISQKFLESILLELKNKGILQSKKGKGGGYALGKHPREITMGQVIRALEGPLAPVSCVSQTAYHKCAECRDEHTCGIRAVMQEVRDAMANILDKTSFEDVVARSNSLKENLAIHFEI